ncbi:Ig-like domain-containing protein [Aquabacterium sp.]|uniref:Ig-like domain-containing protein n=1 Tax=Aquabacterium sp. TaxID=1872578 RepID=UPI002488FD00|nr:Ig-like domain-containing protein [Aquabacterium sp.]MDI1258673.1 Ig-like domain-containing protein [Aquabacterium sp.]
MTADASAASIPLMQAVVAAPDVLVPETSVRHELVFVDAAVPEADKLIQAIQANASSSKVIEVVVIQAGEDGLAVITNALQHRQDLDAVHIISHGDALGLTLGNSRLDTASLNANLGSISSWGQSLAPEADLLLYGCDLSSSAEGRALADNLALLTGADVAASDDLTGATSLGGDWDLEYQHGQIETTVVVEGEAVALWDHVLATLTLQEGTTAGYTDTTDTYLRTSTGVADNTNYGAATTLLAGEDGTGGAAQLLIKFDNLVGSGTNQIPAGSTITGVTLTMQITTQATFTNPSFDFHRMLTTWTGASTWGSMGGGVSAGSGYSNTVDGTITESGTGSFSITNNANMIASVQAWVNSPSSNYGWWTSNGGYSSRIAFASAENGTVASRPKLVVTYTPPTPQAVDLDANNSSGATGSNYSGAFTEQTPLKIADTDATISGGSTTNLTGMTVTIANPLDGVLESLSGTTTGTSITAAYNSGTGVLTLSGTDTVANYQTVLRSITYNNTSDNPTTTSRTINVVATDTNGVSTNSATTTLSVTRVNDAPVINSNGGGTSGSISVRETLTAVTTVSSTDADSGSLTYSISGGADSARFSINGITGVLTFTAAPDFEAPTDVGANNVYDVIVQVSDGTLADTQALAVTVTDVVSTLTVTTITDNNDSGLGTSFTAEQLNALNGGTDTRVSLREAIIAANTTAGTDTIAFAITGVTGAYGEYTITMASALPTITGAVYINAATQTGYTNRPIVVLDGNGGAGEGLSLLNTADGSTIRGLVIRAFSANGIYVQAGSDNNTIVGNYIGSFNADGSNAGAAKRNASEGIEAYGANLTIGGTTAADRNVISGNTSAYNIYLATGADGAVIKGNYIGLNAAGTAAFSTTNSAYGIMIENAATNVTIGGTATGAGNVISGFTNRGVWVTTTGTVTVQGNYIGTDYTGTVDLGNTGYGLYVDDGGSAIIGGTAVGAGNLISGNDGGGIYVGSTGGATIQGNTVGLNAAGTTALGNTGVGIYLNTGNASTVGGNTAAARNIISGNSTYGIQVVSSPTGGHVIKGNYIGVGADGTTLLGNGAAGVYITGNNTTVGGKGSGDGNIIAGNGGAGIAVVGGIYDLFYRNSIYSNTGLGIDLNNDGVTYNDYNDGDGGANYLNNFPVITSVVTNGSSTVISGSIDWYTQAQPIYIEFFSSTSKDASGHGEGKTYLGFAQVTTDATTGDATFSLTVTGVSVGDWITAVANVEGGPIGASEFAMAVQAVAPANAPRGKVIWNANDRYYQSYADWGPSGWSGVGTTGLNLTDDISMIAAAEAPTRNEIIFIGSADVSGKILAAIWNGSTWSSVLSLPVANPGAAASQYDSFAIVYDNVSGDAMLVWDNGNTGTTGLSYATWNGSTWSSIGTITAPVSGEPVQMKLVSNAVTHEMVLAVQTATASNNQYALVWNGSSWGNAQTLGTNTNDQKFEINVAYEQLSGRVMVVYDASASDSSSVQYRLWNGTSWSAESTITAPAGVTVASDVYSTVLASDAKSNRIAIAVQDAADEVWLSVWDGSSWGSGQLATATGTDMIDQHSGMSVAFESQSGDLLAAYGKQATANVFYRTWTSGGGWSAEFTGPSLGGTDKPQVLKLFADPYTNTIMMGVQDDAQDLNFVAWDGSAWGTVTELDSATGHTYRENFTYVWYQSAPAILNLAGDTLAYTEDQAATVIDQGTAASAVLSSGYGYNGGNLTVSFTAGSANAEDVLGVRNQGVGAGQIGVSGANISYAGTVIGTVTGGTGGTSLVITLNANATDAAVSALISNITYQNTNTSAPSTTNRTVRYVLTSATGLASLDNNVTVTVTAVNDAPVNTKPGGQSTNEETALVFSSGNGNLISISDVDAASGSMQVTLSVLHGTLTLSGLTGLSFTSGDGTADGSMVFTGTVANINAALAGLSYTPTSNYAGADTLSIVTSDQGNTGTGGPLTDSDMVAITVNSVNDAPAGASTTITTLEDTAYTFTAADFGFTDASDSPADTLAGVKITTLPGAGTLTLNGVAVTAGQVISAANINSGLLVFTPAANANGAAYTSFTFQVQDNGGAANGGVDLDASPNTMTVNVTAVNDAPAGTNKTITTLEDTAYTFTAADFGFTDASDSPANTLLGVKITTLPGAGSLTLNGVAVTAGQVISSANIASGLLKFTPAANANGAGYASFTFQVQDNGGTANGGVDLDGSPNTMTVSVTAVNDAPAGTNKTVTTNEDTDYTFTAADFGFTDASDSPANTLSGVKITALPGAGSLTLNGVAVTVGQVVSVANINSGLLKFTPVANANGTGYASFTFQVQDNGGTANGGVDLDATPRTMTVDVTTVNDAPAGTNKTITTLEDTAYTFTAADFGFADASDSPAHTLSGVKITTLPVAGSLTLNGVAVTAGQVISAANIASGLLLFTPAANGNGTGYASFTFQVQDSGGTANGGVDLDTTPRTMTVDVTAVNDAPTGTNKTVTTLEDTAYTFTVADFGFTDASDSPANTLLGVKITTLPAAGTLTLSGVAVTAGQVVSSANIASGLLKFTPAANANGTGYASFTFQVQDNGGTANGGVDLDATPRTMTLDVTVVNDAPAGTNKTITTLEDAAYTFTAADFGFTDASDSPANTLAGVKITTLPGAGSLTLNGVAVTAGQVVSVANINSGLLRFTPAANAKGTGYASFTFQVQDNGGTANGGVDLDGSANTMTVNVTTVNDAPAGTNKTITTLEDTAYTFTAADFGFTDPNDSPANTLSGVRITTLPGAGSLTLSGVAVTAGQVVTVANINSGLLKFTPAANANGTGYTSFTFQVQDNGGTANGGVNQDASPNTMTVNVTAVNDAPAGTNKTVTTNEDADYTFTAADFGFTDASDSPANTLLGVKITTLPGTGSLTLNGLAVTAGQVVSVANINSGLLKFVPAANGNGAGYASFTFQVQDNGGTANGGVDLDASPNTMTVDVTAVNDAPAGANRTVTTLENTAYVFSSADFGFTDVSDSPANALLAVKITTTPGAGTLTLNGLVVNAGDFVLASDIAGGLLVFTPAVGVSGQPYADFTFQVQDNGGTANGGVDLDASANTMTVNVTSAVNQAPQGSNNTVTAAEDVAYVFTTADFGFTDLNDTPSNQLLAVKITTVPGAGSLMLNGVAVSAGDFVMASDIAAGGLVFVPGSNASGTAYASFNFQVQDDGGTASGGVDLDATPRTMTVDVTAVNDAPVGADKTVTTSEDVAYTFGASDFGFADPSDAPGNALLAVKITTLPGAGTLTLNGVAVNAGDFILASDIATGKLVYMPGLDGNGAGYASFTFQVQDDGGTANGGVNLDGTPRTLTVDVTSVNDAPVGTDKTVTTIEDTTYTFGTADFGFTDLSDAPGNALQAVKITTLPGAGSLTLNGVAVSAGDFILAIDIAAGKLVYTPGADGNGTAYASFTFQVQDDGGTANGGVNLDATARTLTVDVSSVNDVPVGIDRTVTALEDTAYTFGTADFGFTDPSDAPDNALQAVKITTLPGAGTLTLNGVAVNAGDFILASDIATGKLVYTPGLDGNGAGYASFTFQVQDDGGTANGGVNLDGTARTLTMDVTSVNDAPVGTDKTVTTLEDMAYTFAAADFGFADPSDVPANTLLSVKITTLPGAGTLTLNGVAVNAGDFILASDIAAGKLVYTPGANSNGANHANFTFQVQDDGGTANGGVNLDGTPRTMTVDVTSVNDAPVGADKTVITNEDTAYTFGTADFGFADPSDSPGNALLSVKITTLPGAGTLTLNGVAVNAGDFILASDIAAGKLVYTPGLDGHGAGYASFTFQVQDNGGTANGGVNLDGTPRTMTVDVTSVNDAPTGASTTITTLEDTAYTFGTADFGFADPNDTPANTLLSVKITTLPGAGSLMLNGVAVNAGDFILASDIAAGKLVYTPGLDGNGAGYASFTFQVQDNGGTANGGVSLDGTPRTMAMNVTSVNDAPAGASTTITTLEDTAYTFGTADFGFADPSDAPGNALQAVKITTLPGAGTLTLNGVAVNAGDFILASDIATGKLVYTPGLDGNGAGYASFTFQVQDNGGTANGGVNLDGTARTLTVDVTSVNDAPVGTDKTVTTNEDTAYTFGTADFGFADANDSPANTMLAVKITTLPGAGTLTLNGVAVTAGQTISMANITSGLLKFTPAANANGTGYTSFTFQVQDNGGTAHAGTDLDGTPRTMTVDLTSVNDAPVGADKTVTTNEDTAYTFAAADFGFADLNDSPANTLLTVKITTLPGSGTLSLNGVAVNAGDFILASDIAVGKLVYTSGADGHGAGYASFIFQVQDNGGTANGGVNLDGTARTLTVDVTSVNDAPLGTDKTVTTNEDTAYTFGTADFGFADLNDSPANTLLSVKISTLPGIGTLTLNGVAVNAGDFILASDIAAGKLVYTSGADGHGAGYASFTFQVQDNGGTANGGVSLDGTPRTMAMNVTSVNDAPAGASTTITTLEDTAYTFGTADFGFADSSDAPGNTMLAVKITTLAGTGTLTLNGVAVNAGDFILASDIAAGKLVYTPGADGHGAGYASFTFQVQDNGGTANGGVNLDGAPRTMTVDVTSVNDAPVGTDKTVTSNEDAIYTFTAADFGFTDPNDSPVNALLSVRITTLPGAGSLTLNGVAVTAGQTISVANITSGLLKFTPVANASGTAYASFTFQVQDNGGTANGGVNLDGTARTLTVNVSSVNDAPTGASTTITTLEDTAYTFGTADFGFADTNDAPGYVLQAVKITTLPGAGTLTLNGVAINAGDFILASDIAAGKLVYTPGANGHGAGYSSFTFQVQDNGGTANGGVNLDGTPRTMTMDVTSLNDAPVGADHTVTTNEGVIHTFTVADFGFNDLRDAPGNAFWAVRITTLPVAGNLTLNGVAVNAGDWVQASDIAAGQLIFTPVAGTSGLSYASFTFQVQDNGGTALGGSDTDAVARTMSISVASASVPQGPGPTSPGTGTGAGGGSNTAPGTSPVTPAQPTTPPVEPKDDMVDEIGDKLNESPVGSSNPGDGAQLPPVQSGNESDGQGHGTSGQHAQGGSYATSASHYAANQAGGFVVRLEAGGLIFGVTPGNILLEMSVTQLKVSSEAGLNLSFSTVGVRGSEHSSPRLAFTENTEDRRVKVEKMVVQTSGAALSVGAVWWAARMSGLLASLMISTPAWRSIDPLPVMGLGGGPGPDDEDESDDHADDPNGMDARAARLFGANKVDGRELEGIG